MGSIREFRFITGIETSQNPAAADPSQDDDFMTKGYADSNYGGGGGGGGLVWVTPEGETPPYEDDFGNFQFADDTSQSIRAFVQVPNGYTGGNQIIMYIAIYSPSTSNNVKMKSVTSLIQPDTDAIDSTTNQHTSTEGELTLSAPANKYRRVGLQLTDVNGQINSVDVEQGDILSVLISRDTAGESTSDTEATRFVKSGVAVKFTA